MMAFAVLLFASCVSLPERFDSFVTEVEANYESYSDADWLVADGKCAEFKAEYVKRYDKLNEAERDAMSKCFGRYDAVVAKAKIKSAADGVKRFFDDATKYIEGLVEGVTKDTTDVE